MKHVHFFKAYSRLGLINKPNKSDAVNEGVEHGSDSVLTDGFLRQLDSNYSLSHFDFSNPDKINPKDYEKIIGSESDAFASHINNLLRDHQTQVVVGGDHSTAFPSVLAVLRRVGEDKSIGYVQFDSHGDLHTFKTTPSGNYHGMWLRTLMDNVESKYIDPLVKRHLDPHSCLIYGNLDLEQEEVRFIKANHVDVWSEDDLLADFEFAKHHIKAFVSKYDHIHVSFDIDVFDAQFAPATGTPAPDGLDPSHVFPLLEMLSKAKSLSMDLVEVNPQKNGAESTIDLGQKVIETLLDI
ncbi:MAG: arginase family protein [Patescibacteria group bacterium]